MKNLLREPDRGLGGVGYGITRFAHEPSPKLRFRNPGARSARRKVHSGCYVPSAHRCDSLATILKSNCTQNYEKLEVSK